MKKFTEVVNRSLKSKVTKVEKIPDYVPCSDWDNQEDPVTIPDRDKYDITTYDPYIHAEVVLPHEGLPQRAKVAFRNVIQMET